MVDKQHLLTTRQMAEFAAEGFLRFDEVVPKPLCEKVMEELDAGQHDFWPPAGQMFDDLWPADTTLGQIFRVPTVRGFIHSLVGPHPRFDHYFPHRRQGPSPATQALHQDAEYDDRPDHFDIQISFFPHDVTEDMGGTMFIPGSHFRRVYESEIGRYQNIVGQVQTVCKAGTMVVWHHNLWHCGRPNRTPTTRYMFKLRLNPMVRQTRLWNTDDIDDPEAVRILGKPQPWFGQQARMEHINRIRFWRYLTGDARFDQAYWMTRIENLPQSYYNHQN